jgi:hypothetical protein
LNVGEKKGRTGIDKESAGEAFGKFIGALFDLLLALFSPLEIDEAKSDRSERRS